MENGTKLACHILSNFFFHMVLFAFFIIGFFCFCGLVLAVIYISGYILCKVIDDESCVIMTYGSIVFFTLLFTSVMIYYLCRYINRNSNQYYNQINEDDNVSEV